jgi:hypothetical protein
VVSVAVLEWSRKVLGKAMEVEEAGLDPAAFIDAAVAEVLAVCRLPPVIVPDGTKLSRIVYTPGLARAVFRRLAEGYSFTAACALVAVPREQAVLWSTSSRAVAQLFELGRGLRAARLEADLFGTPAAATVTARLAALRSSHPEEWEEKKTVNLNATFDLSGFLRNLPPLAASPSLPSPSLPSPSASVPALIEAVAVDTAESSETGDETGVDPFS